MVANALMGVHRSLVHYARGRIVAGERSPRLARDSSAEADRAVGRLQDGFGGYGVKGA